MSAHFGFTLYGTYIEPEFDVCFDCPFEECTEEHSHSASCPRRQAELRELREQGIIPDGWLTKEEFAAHHGVNPSSALTVARRLGVDSILLKVGDAWWRFFKPGDKLYVKPRQDAVPRDGKWLDADQAAERFGITANTLRRYFRDGYVPEARKFGKAWAIPSNLQVIQLKQSVLIARGDEYVMRQDGV